MGKGCHSSGEDLAVFVCFRKILKTNQAFGRCFKFNLKLFALNYHLQLGRTMLMGI